MGKKRFSNSPVELESVVYSEAQCYQTKNSSRERRKEKDRHKRFRKGSFSDTCTDENAYERKRHKHKRKKHRHNSPRDTSPSEVEDQHRHRHKHSRSHNEQSSDSESCHKIRHHQKRKKMVPQVHMQEERGIIPSSRWEEESGYDSNRVKEEPISPNQSERLISRPQGRREPNARFKKETGNPREKWGKPEEPKAEASQEEKQKVNFELSGKLTEDANTYNGVVIKYSQPQEARKPKRRWRWYIFKGEQEIPFLPLHRQSAYLIGRERKVADIPTDHPSCSKQHAVLQYRLVSYRREDGTTGRTVKPYIIDLDSANGTYVNNRKIDPKRYVELIEKDVVKFGYSSREYVLLHEGSKGHDDDGIQERDDQLSPVSLLRS